MCGWLLSPVSASASSRLHRPSLSVTIAFLLLFILRLQPPAAQEIDWEIRHVDRAKRFTRMTDRSLAIDESGNLHLVYGQDHLYYSSFDGTDWTHRIVDATPNGGTYAAVAISNKGVVHIVYTNTTYGTLKYARHDGSNWYWETIEGDYKTGYGSSIAVDDAGNPHISYLSHHYYGDDTFLKYMCREGASWQKHTICETHSQTWTSLALDLCMNPVIAFVDDGSLNLASLEDSLWSIEAITPAAGGERCVSLLIDEGDVPHITYRYRGLTHAYFSDSLWVIEMVESGQEVGSCSSVFLDQSENLHVVYMARQGNIGRLKYASWDRIRWVTEEVYAGASNSPLPYPSIVVDPNGRPCISSYKRGSRRLLLSVRIGSAWQHEALARDADVGTGCSLATGNDGRMHASYIDVLNEELKYAVGNGTMWDTTTVDQWWDATWSTSSISVDEAGFPHIAYNTSSGLFRLDYAWWDGEKWGYELIDVITYPSHPSLAVDSSGRPHIACSSWSTGNHGVFHICRGDSAWQLDIVDSESGSSVSLCIDSFDQPHICYQQDYCLQYARWDGSAWNIETVDSDGVYPEYISFALDGSDLPHIICNNSGELQYAHHDGVSWLLECPGISNPYSNSIAVDDAGMPHIVVYDRHGSYSLDYVYRDGSSWKYEAIETTMNVGLPNSIALDLSGNPLTVYYDGVNDDLKYARRFGLPAKMPEPVHPRQFALSSLGPIPFHQSTRLMLELPVSIAARISVFDLMGRNMKSIHNGQLPSGKHAFYWDGTDSSGHRVPSGTYTVSAETGGQRVSKRIVLLR